MYFSKFIKMSKTPVFWSKTGVFLYLKITIEYTKHYTTLNNFSVILQITQKGLHFLNVMDQAGKNIIKTLWWDLSSEEVKHLNLIFQKSLGGKQT
ncbi:hypothetical protein [Bacillus paramycoides]|uniref:hypothetical protein n=1 Tax=Bacillus paramycoides TaxID=2026194 RepID=UPI0037FB6973